MHPWFPESLFFRKFRDMPSGKLSEGDLKSMLWKCCIVEIKAGAIEDFIHYKLFSSSCNGLIKCHVSILYHYVRSYVHIHVVPSRSNAFLACDSEFTHCLQQSVSRRASCVGSCLPRNGNCPSSELCITNITTGSPRLQCLKNKAPKVRPEGRKRKRTGKERGGRTLSLTTGRGEVGVGVEEYKCILMYNLFGSVCTHIMYVCNVIIATSRRSCSLWYVYRCICVLRCNVRFQSN